MPGNKIVVNDNSNTAERVIKFFGEFFGTAVLVFLGCQGCVKLTAIGQPHESIAWIFGLAVMVAIQCFGHVSGGHINPIVTLAAAILGHLPLLLVPIYFLAQFLGALAGYATLMAMTPPGILKGPEAAVGTCSPAFGPGITAPQALLNEFVLSFILTLTCCAVWDWRNTDKHDSVTLRLGFMITVLAMAGGPYSGANMNPARSFAPALLNGDWAGHWVYWVGPLSAGAAAAILYRFAFTKSQPEKTRTPEGIPLNEKA
ncbi:aquaporin AQPcic-like [Onthophagus taurus]|uniref:aquaporin AQPcic-like n=1 Tax=Onthophagus taurus TaxID=166361 RepID=UPI000C20C516|nr:aquaporin AQPcic-like [Onthophagus taurus]